MNLHHLKYYQKFWLLLGILFSIQILPFLVLGDQAYVRIHDTLEGEWLWYEMVIRSKTLFSYDINTIIPYTLNGVTRAGFPSGFSFIMLSIKMMGVYWGYAFNYMVVHIVAIVGMVLLLKDYVLDWEKDKFIIAWVALCFSWLPFFITFGISVAGQPLIIWALLNLFHNHFKKISFSIIFLFPFYSSLVWIGIPVLLFVIGLNLYHYYYLNNPRRLSVSLLVAFVVLFFMYVLINFQLFQLMIFPTDFISHRVEYDYLFNKKMTLGHSLLETLRFILVGHYHVGTMVAIPIILAIIISSYVQNISKKEKIIITFILCVALFAGFYNWLVYFLGDSISLLESFKFDRFLIILPFLWFTLFALILSKINQHHFLKKLVPYFLISQFFIGIFVNDEFQHNFRQIIGQSKKPNFQQFYSASLFDEIDQYISKPKEDYRVVNVGLNPAIPIYNGFYCLDGLQAIYSLKYKHQFRKVIADELQRDSVIQKYFDCWGNRCYVISAELGKESVITHYNFQNQSIQQLNLKTQALKDLGAKYVFATVPINNAAELGLQFEKKFKNKNSYWDIWLYKIRI